MKKTVLTLMATLISCLLLFTTSNAIAQDFCEGNFDVDADVDGNDLFEFKVNFGRSLINDPCP